MKQIFFSVTPVIISNYLKHAHIAVLLRITSRARKLHWATIGPCMLYRAKTARVLADVL